MTDSYFRRNGFTALDGKCGAGNKNCFDGVYVKNGQVYINEVKPITARNTISLSDNSTSPNGIHVQMSDRWVLNRAEELIKSGDPAKIEAGRMIINAARGERLVKIISGVRPDGVTVIGGKRI
ncbi:hypothetical protein [Amphibiibacter pelophylacis]|uniref:Uncharacterized protein n=1 Tax=Amphibiibacter pelophylacis TaxID=1799477 RepID=A0ACC6P4V0_9BURK